MNHPLRKLAALGLFAAFVVLPAALDAQARRGAQVPVALRGRAAYDYYFVPALSLGAYVEYRRLRATIPAFTYAEDVDFYVGSLYTEPRLTRTVEVAVPGRTADLGGWTLGVRLGVRF